MEPDELQPYLVDLARGIIELRNAQPQYSQAEKHYRGEIEELECSNRRIQRRLQASAKKYLFKLARVPLRVMSDRIKLTGITVDASAQDAWQEIWDANQLTVWAKEVHKRAFRYGDAYMKIWPTESSDSGGTEDDDVESAGVTLTYCDPRVTRVIYDSLDWRRPVFALMTWSEGEFDWAQTEYRDRILTWSKRRGVAPIERYTNDEDAIIANNAKGIVLDSLWRLSDYVKSERNADGDMVETAIPQDQPNEWREITIKHWRTELPYGRPEHEAAYGPATAISKALVTQLAVMDAQGWPARYGLTDPAAIVDNAGEEIEWEDDSDAPTIDEQKSRPKNRDTRPGEMDIFDGLKEVGSFVAADPAAFTEPVTLFLKLMSVTTSTPFYSFDPGGEQPSGKSRQIEDEPLNAKCDDREDIFGGTWKESAKLALRMVNKKTKVATPKWKPHTLATTTDDWDAVKATQEAGVPQDASLIMAGMDPDEVQAWTKLKNEMNISLGTMELLGAMGDAMQRVGSALQSNMISTEDAQGIMAYLVAQFKQAAPSPELVQQTAEAELQKAMLQQQVAAGTHDTAGNPVKPTLDKEGKPVKPPAGVKAAVPIKPFTRVGQSTKTAAHDDGRPQTGQK